MSFPLVSVIIPTYNRASMLREALESVRHQTVKDLEILVIDDGSTDETTQVVAGFGEPAIYFKQLNQGVAAARNLGIRKSRGVFVAFLDSDDLWYPQKLERQIDYLSTHPDIGLLYTRM
ncbi:MAG: glycosyltransferase family 2 protein, partial [Candidatus Omnitrophica bacterium]|nr:glycosyltransferase family 2 protein [Candidatus Omnitrophota bacterium]